MTRAYFGLEANAAGATYTTISGATVIAGTYGNLTLHTDGTYTYALTTASIPSGVTSETFTYEIKDGDGDTDLAQLVIGLNQDLNVPETTGSTATVYEDGLADGVQHGATSETATGTFTVDGNNEGYTLTLDGDAGGPVTITAIGDIVTTSKGVLEITSISAPDAGGVVTYGYSYTLSGPLPHSGQGEVTQRHHHHGGDGRHRRQRHHPGLDRHLHRRRHSGAEFDPECDRGQYDRHCYRPY
ncbi:VCBS domain-containing protein [Mesorhizobium sp. Root102]|uniref:Ig-like domain-containing protein n=1 Tax=Mesorhizobium sp. Root102 TaxID=1736422 RepID=UPI001FCDA262|nr:VCBS domain-containing protein [Mesorhizobium sp. Root102]